MAARRTRDRYEPDSAPPSLPGDAADWILRELRRVGTLLDQPRPSLTFAEPAKPQDFVIVVADGASWDPGSGRGAYYWDPDTATWKFVG